MKSNLVHDGRLAAEAALIGASSISRHQGSRLRGIPTLVHDAYTNVAGEFEVVIMIETVTEEMHGSN